MVDLWRAELLAGDFSQVPEDVRRLAAYWYVTVEEYDQRLNALYGYTPRHDEVHPDAYRASTRHALAVRRGIRFVAHYIGQDFDEVAEHRRRFRSLDAARLDFIPSGGRHMPDLLANLVGRSVDYAIREAFHGRVQP